MIIHTARLRPLVFVSLLLTAGPVSADETLSGVASVHAYAGGKTASGETANPHSLTLRTAPCPSAPRCKSRMCATAKPSLSASTIAVRSPKAASSMSLRLQPRHLAFLALRALRSWW